MTTKLLTPAKRSSERARERELERRLRTTKRRLRKTLDRVSTTANALQQSAGPTRPPRHASGTRYVGPRRTPIDPNITPSRPDTIIRNLSSATKSGTSFIPEGNPNQIIRRDARYTGPRRTPIDPDLRPARSGYRRSQPVEAYIREPGLGGGAPTPPPSRLRPAPRRNYIPKRDPNQTRRRLRPDDPGYINQPVPKGPVEPQPQRPYIPERDPSQTRYVRRSVRPARTRVPIHDTGMPSNIPAGKPYSQLTARQRAAVDAMGAQLSDDPAKADPRLRPATSKTLAARRRTLPKGLWDGQAPSEPIPDPFLRAKYGSSSLTRRKTMPKSLWRGEPPSEPVPDPRLRARYPIGMPPVKPEPINIIPPDPPKFRKKPPPTKNNPPTAPFVPDPKPPERIQFTFEPPEKPPGEGWASSLGRRKLDNPIGSNQYASAPDVIKARVQKLPNFPGKQDYLDRLDKITADYIEGTADISQIENRSSQIEKELVELSRQSRQTPVASTPPGDPSTLGPIHVNPEYSEYGQLKAWVDSERDLRNPKPDPMPPTGYYGQTDTEWTEDDSRRQKQNYIDRMPTGPIWTEYNDIKGWVDSERDLQSPKPNPIPPTGYYGQTDTEWTEEDSRRAKQSYIDRLPTGPMQRPTADIPGRIPLSPALRRAIAAGPTGNQWIQPPKETKEQILYRMRIEPQQAPELGPWPGPSDISLVDSLNDQEQFRINTEFARLEPDQAPPYIAFNEAALQSDIAERITQGPSNRLPLNLGAAEATRRSMAGNPTSYGPAQGRRSRGPASHNRRPILAG